MATRVSRRDVLAVGLSASVSMRATAGPKGGGAGFDLIDLPFRQADPAWGHEVLWARERVLRADAELNGHPASHGPTLLRAFDDGNTVANEGCLLTCLAMVLRLFQPAATPKWTPSRLRSELEAAHVLTPSGLSLSTLVVDVVCDLTAGEVQLSAKEDYLPGEDGRPATFASRAPLVRAYRGLTAAARRDVLLMLKTGTWDDTVASHYVVVHPAWTDGSDDVEVLDPAMPPGPARRWRLSDSAAVICQDGDIARAWKAAGLKPTQLAGAWAFTRPSQPGHGALVRAWADALSPR
ncbi:MAG: hypothetical protein SFW67_07695 [Myxococcaceae bacterium]|nr:hypothetical protein [Myxococcaceae bacterium]